MKKILLVLFVIVSTTLYARTTIIRSDYIPKRSNDPYSDNIYQKILCIDGYKFLLTYTLHSYSSSTVVQMFEKIDGKSVPMECRNK